MKTRREEIDELIADTDKAINEVVEIVLLTNGAYASEYVRNKIMERIRLEIEKSHIPK